MRRDLPACGPCVSNKLSVAELKEPITQCGPMPINLTQAHYPLVRGPLRMRAQELNLIRNIPVTGALLRECSPFRVSLSPPLVVFITKEQAIVGAFSKPLYRSDHIDTISNNMNDPGIGLNSIDPTEPACVMRQLLDDNIVSLRITSPGDQRFISRSCLRIDIALIKEPLCAVRIREQPGDIHPWIDK
ncbi:MAG: hypothetical protein R3B67_04485 [Phycisphaerales bacterium]